MTIENTEIPPTSPRPNLKRCSPFCNESRSVTDLSEPPIPKEVKAVCEDTFPFHYLDEQSI